MGAIGWAICGLIHGKLDLVEARHCFHEDNVRNRASAILSLLGREMIQSKTYPKYPKGYRGYRWVLSSSEVLRSRYRWHYWSRFEQSNASSLGTAVGTGHMRGVEKAISGSKNGGHSPAIECSCSNYPLKMLWFWNCALHLECWFPLHQPSLSKPRSCRDYQKRNFHVTASPS